MFSLVTIVPVAGIRVRQLLVVSRVVIVIVRICSRVFSSLFFRPLQDSVYHDRQWQWQDSPVLRFSTLKAERDQQVSMTRNDIVTSITRPMVRGLELKLAKKKKSQIVPSLVHHRHPACARKRQQRHVRHVRHRHVARRRLLAVSRRGHPRAGDRRQHVLHCGASLGGCR